MSKNCFDLQDDMVVIESFQEYCSPIKPSKHNNLKHLLNIKLNESTQKKEDLTQKINLSNNIQTPKQLFVFKCINHQKKKAKYYEINEKTNGKNLYCSSCAISQAQNGIKIYELFIDDDKENSFNIQNEITKKKQNESSLSLSSLKDDNLFGQFINKLSNLQSDLENANNKVQSKEDESQKALNSKQQQIENYYNQKIKELQAQKKQSLQKVESQHQTNQDQLINIKQKIQQSQQRLIYIKNDIQQKQQNIFIDNDIEHELIQCQEKLQQIYDFNQKIQQLTILNQNINYENNQQPQTKLSIYLSKTPRNGNQIKFSQRGKLVFKPVQSTQRKHDFFSPQSKIL